MGGVRGIAVSPIVLAGMVTYNILAVRLIHSKLPKCIGSINVKVPYHIIGGAVYDISHVMTGRYVGTCRYVAPSPWVNELLSCCL
jgi:hypothetical protein